MLITFSHPLDRADSIIREVARRAGCYAKLGRDKGWAVSFVLTARYDSNDTATPEQHDDVIGQLLTLDPRAKVKTARAVYEGLADFEAQRKARI